MRLNTLRDDRMFAVARFLRQTDSREELDIFFSALFPCDLYLNTSSNLREVPLRGQKPMPRSSIPIPIRVKNVF